MKIALKADYKSYEVRDHVVNILSVSSITTFWIDAVIWYI